MTTWTQSKQKHVAFTLENNNVNLPFRDECADDVRGCLVRNTYNRQDLKLCLVI